MQHNMIRNVSARDANNNVDMNEHKLSQKQFQVILRILNGESTMSPSFITFVGMIEHFESFKIDQQTTQQSKNTLELHQNMACMNIVFNRLYNESYFQSQLSGSHGLTNLADRLPSINHQNENVFPASVKCKILSQHTRNIMNVFTIYLILRQRSKSIKEQ